MTNNQRQDEGYEHDPRHDHDQDNRRQGYRWNPRRGVVANLFGLGFSTLPSFFGALGDFAGELKEGKKRLNDYDKAKKKLKEGIPKYAERLEELAEQGVVLHDNPTARVAHFGNYFELGLKPTADAKGRPATFGFIVLNNAGQTGVYAYSHPGFFADVDYFKEPKPRTANEPIPRACLNAPSSDTTSSPEFVGRFAKLRERLGRAYDTTRVVGRKAVEMAKDIHQEVEDVEDFIGDPAKMREQLDKRAKEITSRGGRIRDWSDYCEVREYGPFVELEVPIPSDSHLGSVTQLRDTYMVNLITGEIKSRYPPVKKRYSGPASDSP